MDILKRKRADYGSTSVFNFVKFGWGYIEVKEKNEKFQIWHITSEEHLVKVVNSYEEAEAFVNGLELKK